MKVSVLKYEELGKVLKQQQLVLIKTGLKICTDEEEIEFLKIFERQIKNLRYTKEYLNRLLNDTGEVDPYSINLIEPSIMELTNRVKRQMDKNIRQLIKYREAIYNDKAEEIDDHHNEMVYMRIYEDLEKLMR